MNILVTAGNTQTPIDRVRAITNIFTGRTGAAIAVEAYRRGHTVTLLTSHPEAVEGLKILQELKAAGCTFAERWTLTPYRTFDDLQALMADHVRQPGLDALIHTAAVSDYQSAGIYAPDAATHFRATDRSWENAAGQPPTLTDMTAGKVKSDAEELWLRMVRAPKLVDCVRSEWGFEGVLVKFKLEVGVRDDVLLEIAERSRVQSSADVMVANTLEDAHLCAYVGPLEGMYHRIPRHCLATRVLEIVESLRPTPGLEAPLAQPAEAPPTGRNILLGVTGSVAAILTPDLYAALKRHGHQVKVVATSSALYFFDPKVLDPSRPARNSELVILDEDEWPGRDSGKRWQRDDPVLHIELRRWADMFLIAPLDANTLAKFANGLSDNCLTCVWRAWDPARPRVLAPAMNTLMWEHPLTLRHLRQLGEDAGGSEPPRSVGLEGLLAWIDTYCPAFRIVAPQSKRLACGDVGVGAMAALDDILSTVNTLLPH